MLYRRVYKTWNISEALPLGMSLFEKVMLAKAHLWENHVLIVPSTVMVSDENVPKLSQKVGVYDDLCVEVPSFTKA